MPTRPPTRCPEPGCYALVPKGRCEAHQRIPWAGRDDKQARYGISSGQWRTLKARVTRRDHGCCYRCGIDQADVIADDPEASEHVLDHITPISEGGSATHMDNLGLLCTVCDAIKSKSEALRANHARRKTR